MTTKAKAAAKTVAAADERTSDTPIYVDIKLTKMIEVDGERYRPGAKIRVLSSEVPKFADAL